MELAPIALFVYNRPNHTLQTLEALKNNYLANESTLFIFVDGAKSNATENDLRKIKEVKRIIRSDKWCKEIIINESDTNLGCDDSIILGVTKIINKYKKIIVLEDDIVTSRGFLKYMNDALNLYENNERVMHISGYIFPVNKKLPTTFFYRPISSWGWATWQRAWLHYNNNAEYLIKQIKLNNKINDFSLQGYFGYYELLKENAEGLVYNWDIKWYASTFLLNGLSLNPGISLVQNIGFDGTGLHCEKNTLYQWDNLAEKINVFPIKVDENKKAVRIIKKFGLLKRTSLYYRVQFLKLIPETLTNIIKISFLKKHRELNKIKKLPPYIDLHNKTFNIFKFPLRIYNKNDFFSSYEETFVHEIFKFNTENPQPFIIEIGSNIGISTIYFNQLFPNSRMIVYEAYSWNYDALNFNLKSFKLTNVIAITGNLNEFINNNLLKDLSVNKIDLIKIDIPGKEMDILNKLYPILENIDKLFIRYSSFQKEKQILDQILTILTNKGYRYYLNISSYKSPHPFYEINIGRGIDNQINIFAYKL